MHQGAVVLALVMFTRVTTTPIPHMPQISSTLVGMPTCTQVAANVQTVLEVLDLVPDARKEQHTAAAAAVDTVLAPCKNTTWPSGRPENDALPV